MLSNKIENSCLNLYYIIFTFMQFIRERENSEHQIVNTMELYNSFILFYK